MPARLNEDQLNTPSLEPYNGFLPEQISYLFNRYYDGLYRYIFYLTNDRESAEDLTNEVFLRLCRSVQSGSVPLHALPGWLYRVARNLVIDEYRRHAPTLSELAADEPLLAQPVEDAFAHQDIRAVFDELTHEQQQVLYLRFVEGFEPSEIATLMGKTAGAVKQLQYRALATLRRLLTRVGYKP